MPYLFPISRKPSVPQTVLFNTREMSEQHLICRRFLFFLPLHRTSQQAASSQMLAPPEARTRPKIFGRGRHSTRLIIKIVSNHHVDLATAVQALSFMQFTDVHFTEWAVRGWGRGLASSTVSHDYA